MMFGHVETLAERIEHLDRLRQLQDETGGLHGVHLLDASAAARPVVRRTPSRPQDGVDMSAAAAGAFEYLKTQAIARLYLDNIPNIQSSWVTQGEKIGQLALLFGANDMGSLMIEENVVAQAGTVHPPDAARRSAAASATPATSRGSGTCSTSTLMSHRRG